jgi:hypothetical protein
MVTCWGGGMETETRAPTSCCAGNRLMGRSGAESGGQWGGGYERTCNRQMGMGTGATVTRLHAPLQVPAH